jgi:hypothetical protein
MSCLCNSSALFNTVLHFPFVMDIDIQLNMFLVTFTLLFVPTAALQSWCSLSLVATLPSFAS